MLFTDEHDALRAQVRAFVERELAPHVDAWERAGGFPRALYPRAAAAGVLGAGYPEAYGGLGGDAAHQVVVLEELSRAGSGGLAAGLSAHGIALAPILAGGTHEQKERLCRPVLAGEKVACLAVTEPGCGSDVQAIATRAVREGEHYRVSGRKIFITNGCEADLCTTLVRTGEAGAGGLSVLVLDAHAKGFTVTRRLEKLGWRASDTAELLFEDVRVPVANRIGAEGDGFGLAMQNFATERIFLAVGALALAELAYEAALGFARQREVFGKPLAAHQVTRHKLAEMVTALEVAKAYSYRVIERVRAGEPCVREAAIAKNAATDAACRVVDQALQLHGGYGFMQEYLVERLYRDIRLYPIGGGTREIMNEIIARTL